MFLLILLSFYHSTFAAPGDGPYYNCSTLKNQADCINTFWCIWEKNAQSCLYDECLFWKPDTTLSCEDVQTGGIPCEMRYLNDGIDCDTGVPSQVDRFCRINIKIAQTYDRKSLAGEICFYEDLKAIGKDAGARSCGNKVCSWKNKTDVGSYCDSDGGEDCSSLTTPEEICPCLGKEHCDLYPRCVVDGNNCKPDPCNKARARTEAAAGDTCLIGNDMATDCKARHEFVWNMTTEALEDSLFCTSAGTTPNECYWAFSSVVQPTPWPAEDPEKFCEKIIFDETICTQAKTLDEKATPAPRASDKACQLVDIPAGYFANKKYCTDGDRKIPSVSAGSSIHVSLYAFLLVMVAIFTL